MSHLIAVSRNGVEIEVNLVKSHASKQISEHPHLLTLLKELLENTTVSRPEMIIEKDMGRVIGTTDIVQTTEKDIVVYAQRLGEETFTPFVKNRQPDTSTYLSLILKQTPAKNYELWDVWIGQFTPVVPGHEEEVPESIPYWEEHAFIWGSRLVQPRTVTRDCPY